MNNTRHIKKFEEFSICCNISDGDNIISEHKNLGFLLYHIGVRGTGRVGIPFSSNYKELDTERNKLVCMKDWIYEHKIYTTNEHSELYGFNTNDANQDWDAKLITESFIGDDKSLLICFDGACSINNTSIEKMDYIELDNKEYNLDLNGGFLVMFTKKF